MAHAEPSGPGRIIDEFLLAAERHPDHPALIGHPGPTGTLTYGQLAVAAGAAAAVLRAHGVGPGVPVRLRGPVGGPLAAHLLGAWRLGAVVWLDGDGPAAAAGPTEEVPLLTVSSGRTEETGYSTDRPLPADLAAALRQLPAHRAEIAAAGGGYLVRTSGSTGHRKVILGSQSALAAFAAWQRTAYDWSPEDRVPALTGLDFDVVYRELVTTLTSGATLLCPPPEVAPSRVLGWLAEQGATVLHVVPSLARYWLTAARAAKAAGTPALRATFFAGEPLDAQLARRWRAETGPAQQVVNLYGPSETTLAKFHHRVPADQADGAVPVGRPLPGTLVTVVDPETGAGQPEGAPGEVVITTPQGSFGYLGDPGPEVAARFRRDAGLVTFRTGDLGVLRPEGLVLLGRLDSRVKLNGVWVNLHEVEGVLRTHLAVAEAVVVGERTGPALRLGALVVLREPVDPQALRTHVLHRLGSPAVPARVVPVDRLPRLATGKTDRTALRRLLARTPSGPAEPAAATLEALVRRIGLTAAQLSGTTADPGRDLIDGGLDLTGAAELCAVLAEEFGVDCSPGDVFAHPDPQELGRLLLTRARPGREG
ncbi:AMP-binding protein [Kitasatospora sp. NPDC051853]|uniref:AMP-binding protein n=1 Tax=Kitasatospora sp. NPDC051853 TaxID=3364058 RepID=UPI0037A79BEF